MSRPPDGRGVVGIRGMVNAEVLGLDHGMVSPSLYGGKWPCLTYFPSRKGGWGVMYEKVRKGFSGKPAVVSKPALGGANDIGVCSYTVEAPRC